MGIGPTRSGCTESRWAFLGGIAVAFAVLGVLLYVGGSTLL